MSKKLKYFSKVVQGAFKSPKDLVWGASIYYQKI